MPTYMRIPNDPVKTPTRRTLETALLAAAGGAGNARARKALDIGFRRVTQGPLALGWQDLPYAVRPGHEPPLQILNEVYGVAKPGPTSKNSPRKTVKKGAKK